MHDLTTYEDQAMIVVKLLVCYAWDEHMHGYEKNKGDMKGFRKTHRVPLMPEGDGVEMVTT